MNNIFTLDKLNFTEIETGTIVQVMNKDVLQEFDGRKYKITKVDLEINEPNAQIGSHCSEQEESFVKKLNCIQSFKEEARLDLTNDGSKSKILLTMHELSKSEVNVKNNIIVVNQNYLNNFKIISIPFTEQSLLSLAKCQFIFGDLFSPQIGARVKYAGVDGFVVSKLYYFSDGVNDGVNLRIKLDKGMVVVSSDNFKDIFLMKYGQFDGGHLVDGQPEHFTSLKDYFISPEINKED